MTPPQSPRWSLRNRVVVLLAVVAALAVVSVSPSTTSAFFQGGEYEHTDSNCTGPRRDPITAIFYGSAATSNTLNSYDNGPGIHHGNIERFTGWKFHRGEAVAYHITFGTCEPTDGQMASRTGPFHSRFHIRTWQSYYKVGGNNIMFGTPHHEDWVWTSPANPYCTSPVGGNHAVDKGAVDRGSGDRTSQGSGFDQARRKLMDAYNADGGKHHDVSVYNYGNTHSFKQCDGDWAGSNGNVVKISVGLY